MDLSSFTQRIAQAFNDYLSGIFRALPAIGAGLLLLLLGWGLAHLLRKLIHRIFHRTGIHGAAERSGLDKVFGRLGGLTVVVGGLVYWLVQLFFILASAEVMDLSIVRDAIHRFFAYVPVLLTSVGIFVFGIWLAERVQNLATSLGSSMGLVGVRVIGRILFGIILIFMSVTALNMAGVDTTLITSNILLLVGGILLAFSVAYGFASKDILTNILSSYYGKDRFHPGMRVRIGNDEGVVEGVDSINITLRTTDRLVLIPTRALITERIEVLEDPGASEGGHIRKA